MSGFRLVSSHGAFYPDENPPKWGPPTLVTSSEPYDPFRDGPFKSEYAWNTTEPQQILDSLGEEADSKPDPVKAPSHYIDGRKYEPRLVIQDWKLSWELGNALKYIARAGRKDDEAQDIRKAIEYLKYRLEVVEG